MLTRYSPPRTHRKAGFSLIEILIVLAIIALLTGVVILNVEGIFGGGQEQTAQIFVNSSVKAPLLSYKIHLGNYPSTAEGLKALKTAPAGKQAKWKGPYVDKIPSDPWSNPYQYRFPGTKNPKGYDCFSFGPDGTESADDIGNWE
jgi:general secretion pathway protein G